MTTSKFMKDRALSKPSHTWLLQCSALPLQEVTSNTWILDVFRFNYLCQTLWIISLKEPTNHTLHLEIEAQTNIYTIVFSKKIRSCISVVPKVQLGMKTSLSCLCWNRRGDWRQDMGQCQKEDNALEITILKTKCKNILYGSVPHKATVTYCRRK